MFIHTDKVSNRTSLEHPTGKSVLSLPNESPTRKCLAYIDNLPSTVHGVKRKLLLPTNADNIQCSKLRRVDIRGLQSNVACVDIDNSG